MRRIAAFAGAVLLAVAHAPALAQDWARLAPYRDITWPADSLRPPRVKPDTTWFDLVAIDDAAVPRLIAAARSTFGSRWQARFSEDIVEVLKAAGLTPRDSVTLSLRDDAGRDVRLRAALNRENRVALLTAVRSREGTARPATGTPSPPRHLTREDAQRDIDALQREMESRWAYLRTNGVDYRRALEALRAKAGAGIEAAEYAREVEKIIGMFIDGHAAVIGVSYPAGQLPLLIGTTNGRYLAIAADARAFADSAYPYITAIDGRPMDDWIAAASLHVPDASRQWVVRNALRHVTRVSYLRTLMGLPARDSVTVILASRDGARLRRMTLPVEQRGGSLQRGPWGTSRLLDDSVGYLRLRSMDAAAVQEVATWMPAFRSTRGLIIDVRGNTGGSRDALRALFPYLMSPGDTPRVVNAATYRLHPDYNEGHLGGSRYMYRADAPEWMPAERAAIEEFRKTFTPEWNPPANEFSDWHYLVMSQRTNPAAYHYTNPVIVLLDQDSFSATDIFVAAFKGWRNVTLMGTPSGGGSARQVPVRLPVSGLMLSLASMASFQRDGRLFDGRGTEPDIVVHPEPEYLLLNGRDAVLERARARLAGR